MTAVELVKTKGRRILRWQQATWEEYVRVRDRHQISDASRVKLFFHQGFLLVDDMGWEGINHSTVRGLFAYLFFCWFSQQSEQTARSFDGCLLEKEGEEAGSPDLVLYVGDEYPQWSAGESRKINLDKWRAPDLVGEVSDTTLTSDLDQKKRLYASLDIPEYWVVDVAGNRAFLFCLSDDGEYAEVTESRVLSGLTGKLLSQAMVKLNEMSNMQAANWCHQKFLDSKD